MFSRYSKYIFTSLSVFFVAVTIFAYHSYFDVLLENKAMSSQDRNAVIAHKPQTSQTPEIKNNSLEATVPETPTESATTDESSPLSQTSSSNKSGSGEVKGQMVVEKPTSASTPTPKPKQPTTVSCTGSFSTQLICLINLYRVEKGLNKVSADTTLSAVALSHSIWMETTGNFSHEGIDGSRMFNRCATAGIRCLAENLAYKVKSPQEVMTLWKQNPGHNKNLLGPYSTAGVGISGKYLTLLLN